MKKATTKTLAQTIDQIGKDLARLEKAIIRSQKRFAAALKKSQKLQERISKLEAAGRIVRLNKDAEIVAGDNEWYVKAESLNEADQAGNWYYRLDGYGDCSCESRETTCKHSRKLSESFKAMEEQRQADERRAAFVASFDPCLVA